MRRLKETRGAYTIYYYEVDITEAMRKKAYEFSEKIIKSNNQYERLVASENVEIQRTYVGKLGEVAFYELLKQKGINIDISDMFEIFSGQANVDNFDFVTKSGETVDIKTGFRDIHKKLLINKEQFENIPKDYYVGVKLNAKDDTNSLTKEIDINSITKATIYGYADYNFLKNKVGYKYFGEDYAKFIEYNQLMGIDKLLSKF